MLKTLKTKDGKYEREEVIRRIMGGVLYVEKTKWNNDWKEQLRRNTK